MAIVGAAHSTDLRRDALSQDRTESGSRRHFDVGFFFAAGLVLFFTALAFAGFALDDAVFALDDAFALDEEAFAFDDVAFAFDDVIVVRVATVPERRTASVWPARSREPRIPFIVRSCVSLSP